MEPKAPLISRLRVRNYKSLRDVNLRLGRVAVLVGLNGAGKSNIVDALRFVRDAVEINLDFALRERGGINDVRRRSSGHPNHFGIRLELASADGVSATYAFSIEAVAGQSFRVAREMCWVQPRDPFDGASFFKVERGVLVDATPSLQAAVSDRDLYLRAVSGERAFSGVYEALRNIGVYNPNPAAIRNLQDPDPSDMLRRDASNLPSLMLRMRTHAPDALARINTFLGRIVPGITEVSPVQLGPKETLQFRQSMDNKNQWKFYASSMSDGTLRSLAVLGAAFQPKVDLVAIEEPEVALHPGAARILAEALLEASTRVQVLMTTHSPDLLDTPGIDPSSVFVVGVVRGHTVTQPMEQSNAEVVREGLFTAGELLRLGQLEPEYAGEDAKAASQAELFQK